MFLKHDTPPVTVEEVLALDPVPNGHSHFYPCGISSSNVLRKHGPRRIIVPTWKT